MRKHAVPWSLSLVALCLSSCVAGPHQLRRTIDDWDHKLYVNSPWGNVALWIVPVIPVGELLARIGDFLVTDPYAFWFDDAWDGKGTAYRHLPVQGTDGSVGSLLMPREDWTRQER